MIAELIVLERKIMNYISIIPETSVDGEGLRTSIYVSGCNHHCNGCHNPQTGEFNQGNPLTLDVIDSVVQQVRKNPLLAGITFSGGDPLEVGNADDLLPILKYIKAHCINIWCYTGYTYEELKNMSPQNSCLEYIDYLVDGPFIKELKDPTLVYRGSSNQRIIKMKPTPHEYNPVIL